MKTNLLSLLGLSMRAGKLVTGDESVLKTVRSGEAKLVVLAQDAAVNAKKKYHDKCHFYEVPLIECCSRSELGSSIGKNERIVIAVTDSGLAQSIIKCHNKPAEVESID